MLDGGVLHQEAISNGAVFPLLSFTDGSKGIYCLGIPETPQCGPAPVPTRCLSVPEPGANSMRIVAMAAIALLGGRRLRSPHT